MDGDFKLAVVHLEKAYAADSNNVNTLSMLGYSYYHAANYKKAINTFGRLISLRPNETSAYYYRGKARHLLATETYGMAPIDREKLYQAAIKDFSKAIEANGDDPKFYQNRALVYKDYGILKGQKTPKFYDKTKSAEYLKAAISDFQTVLTLSPGRKDISTQIQETKDYLQNIVNQKGK